MKKYILFGIGILICHCVFAQNEGRFGIFTAINNTSLLNAADNSFGDYYPTFKPSYGVEASYHFTVAKVIPMGFSVQLMKNYLGQNYHGYYADSSSYWAYRRLNYLRGTLGWHVGTNIRRQVSAMFSAGITYGFLTSYQDKYELIRYNNDRFIFDVKNNDVNYYDTIQKRGTLNNQLFNKTDNTFFVALGLNFLLSKRIVLGVQGRMDKGFGTVENTASKYSISYSNTTPATVVNYTPYNSKNIYRKPVGSETRGETKNSFMGVYISLNYRIYNKEKVEFWYKEHGPSNN